MSSVSSDPERAAQEPVERASPGLAALFDTLQRDGRHTFLDLGSADGRRLRILGAFARQVRFGGVVPRTRPVPWAETARALAPNPEVPYDVVLLWDALDQLEPDERPLLIERLSEITAPHAVLYAVVDASGSVARRPLSFTILDTGHVEQRPAGPAAPASPALLPAQVERLLTPFAVMHAFALRLGLREYVARKQG